MDRDAVEEIKRHFGVVAEDLRSQVRAVAEGQDSLREGLDSLREGQDSLREGQDSLRREFHALRVEVGREFEETRALIRLSHAELDRRVHSLEAEVGDLRERLERLESRVGS